MRSAASAEPERKAEGTALAKAWRPAVQGTTQRLGPVGGGRLPGGSPGGGGGMGRWGTLSNLGLVM